MLNKRRLLTLLAICFLSSGISSPHQMSPTLAAFRRVAILTLAADNNYFTNPIVNSIVYHLHNTKTKLEFNILPFAENPLGAGKLDYTNKYIKLVKDFNPDVVVIADDKLYTLLFSEIARLGTHVTTFFSNLERHEVKKGRQSVLFNDYPAKEIIRYARKLKKIDRAAILGNPWSTRNGRMIVDKVKSSVDIDYFEAKSWAEWKNLLRKIEANYDIVWLFLPYGVEDESGKQVDFNRAVAAIKGLKIPTIGFGQSKWLKRTITVGMVLDSIGRSLASMVYRYLIKGEAIDDSYRSFDISLNYRDCKRLGLKIPSDLIQHVEL